MNIYYINSIINASGKKLQNGRNGMVIKSVLDCEFRNYGRILKGYDFSELCEAMMDTECPENEVIYVPGDPKLEALPIYKDLTEREYGGLPVQIGYCNGFNKALNALEYHRSSEINIAVKNDLILLLGKQQDVSEDYTYDTSLVEAFLVPAGVGVELFATTLHYAPVAADGSPWFRCVVVLPQGTNTELQGTPCGSPEDRLLTAKNKWLIAHPDADIEGAFTGLYGKNMVL